MVGGTGISFSIDSLEETDWLTATLLQHAPFIYYVVAWKDKGWPHFLPPFFSKCGLWWRLVGRKKVKSLNTKKKIAFSFSFSFACNDKCTFTISRGTPWLTSLNRKPIYVLFYFMRKQNRTRFMFAIARRIQIQVWALYLNLTQPALFKYSSSQFMASPLSTSCQDRLNCEFPIFFVRNVFMYSKIKSEPYITRTHVGARMHACRYWMYVHASSFIASDWYVIAAS